MLWTEVPFVCLDRTMVLERNFLVEEGWLSKEKIQFGVHEGSILEPISS